MELYFVQTEEFNHKEPKYSPIEAELSQESSEKPWWSTNEYQQHPSLIMRLLKKGKS